MRWSNGIFDLSKKQNDDILAQRVTTMSSHRGREVERGKDTRTKGGSGNHPHSEALGFSCPLRVCLTRKERERENFVCSSLPQTRHAKAQRTLARDLSTMAY